MNSLSRVSGVAVDPGNAESFVYEEAAGDANLLDGSQPGKPASDDAKYSEAEVSRLVAAAKAEGIREGEERARAAAAGQNSEQARQRVADALTRFQSERTDYYSKVEVEIVHLSLAIAAKILHRESQMDRLVLAGLVRVALEHLQQNTNIRLRVPAGEITAWQTSLHDIANLSITEDPAVEADDCVLETDIGSGHLGLNAQLKEVEQGFFDLLARRPPTQ